jgi:hypothetical protein
MTLYFQFLAVKLAILAAKLPEAMRLCDYWSPFCHKMPANWTSICIVCLINEGEMLFSALMLKRGILTFFSKKIF